ncbi:MAG: hypothetical protein DRJ30_07175 [Candidatus Methanomethylicota archaeon]|nr:MAG: hypothetical protein DRJ30_07175 [Candidatus Verstraetearchaeota archaeon]
MTRPTKLTYSHIINELQIIGRPILLYDLYLRLRRKLKSKFNYNTFMRRIRDLEKGVKIKGSKGLERHKIKIMKMGRFKLVYLPEWQSIKCDHCNEEIKGRIYRLCELCYFASIDIDKPSISRVLRKLEDTSRLKIEAIGKQDIAKLHHENYETLFIAEFLAALLKLLDPIQAEAIIEFYNELSIKYNLKLPNLRTLQYKNEVMNLANKIKLAIQNKITS